MCLLVGKIIGGDTDNKTYLFSIRANILCCDSSVISTTGLDYCSLLVFKERFNNTASLAGIKSRRHLCQTIPLCLCTLFAFKKHQDGAYILHTVLFVFIYVSLWARTFHARSRATPKKHIISRLERVWLISGGRGDRADRGLDSC